MGSPMANWVVSPIAVSSATTNWTTSREIWRSFGSLAKSAVRPTRSFWLLPLPLSFAARLGPKPWPRIEMWHRFSIARDPPHAAWRALRADEASRPIGLAVPRFLARAPYGARTVPIEAFRFEEDLGDGAPTHFLWSNAAYLMAINIAHAFATYGWCARIFGLGSSGRIDGLSCFQAPGLPSAPNQVGPTEIAIGEGQEQQLAAQGLMPLIRTGDMESAAFLSAPLLHKPTGVERSEAGDKAPLPPSLASLLTVNRFARAIKLMLDGRLRSPLSTTDLQVLLERWIGQYVDAAPHEADSNGAKRPLSDASIEIEEIAGEPKRYRAKIRIEPRYQFDGQRVPIEVSTMLRFS